MDLMNVAQLLGDFGEFVGAIAVVATLIYLALQIRQKHPFDRRKQKGGNSNTTKANSAGTPIPLFGMRIPLLRLSKHGVANHPLAAHLLSGQLLVGSAHRG